MSNEPTRTLAYICPACKQPVIAQRTVFTLCASRTAIPCPCGKSTLTVEPLAMEYEMTVPCSFCGKDHHAVVPEKAFLHQKAISLACAASGLDCCYVGEEAEVFSAMRRLEEAMDKLADRKKQREQDHEEEDTFLDPIVMQEMLSELKEIASRDGISCDCGSHQWRLEIHYSSLELVCADCGATLRIPAATQEDITDLCCKPTLRIRKEE